MGTRNKGNAASLPNIHMPLESADTNLRNSRKPTAKKVGHRRPITRNQMISRAGSAEHALRKHVFSPIFCLFILRISKCTLSTSNGHMSSRCLPPIPSQCDPPPIPSRCWVHPDGRMDSFAGGLMDGGGVWSRLVGQVASDACGGGQDFRFCSGPSRSRVKDRF